MNIALDIQNIDISHSIKLLDTRCNNIMEGEFTKILYSDEFVTLNGLYLNCPLQLGNTIASLPPPPGIPQPLRHITHSPYPYKHILTFQPNSSINMILIHKFAQFEKILIDYYKQYTFCKKKPVYLLQNQLLCGYTKFYRDIMKNTVSGTNTSGIHYVVKISGIWEAVDTVGITYKILEMYDKVLT